jgi:hypothetical protein
MDDLDHARVIVVEAIATLENAVEALMPAQAPGSSRDEIHQGIDQMRSVAERLIQHAQAVEAVMDQRDRDDS